MAASLSRSREDDISFEGLEAISAHIDPTDFIAFNNYERNLRIFSNFALNTDSEQTPWVVVNTGDRYVIDQQLISCSSLCLILKSSLANIFFQVCRTKGIDARLSFTLACL